MQVLLPSFFFGRHFTLWVVPLKSVRAVKYWIIIHYQYFVVCTHKPSGCAMGPFVPQALEIFGREGHQYGRCCSLDRSFCLFGLDRRDYRTEPRPQRANSLWTSCLQTGGGCCLNPAPGSAVHLAAQTQPLKAGGGKGLKGLPFHLTQICKKYVHKNGMVHRECCWEEGELFVFCLPPKYNLFKYLHDLLLKGFLSFPTHLWFIKLWMGERERFVIANSSSLSKKCIVLFT